MHGKLSAKRNLVASDQSGSFKSTITGRTLIPVKFCLPTDEQVHELEMEEIARRAVQESMLEYQVRGLCSCDDPFPYMLALLYAGQQSYPANL